MPATPADAKGLLKSAIRDDNPVVFIEGEMLYNTKGEVPDGEYVIPLGKADVKREGGDVTDHLPLEDGRASRSRPPSSWRARGSRRRWSTCARSARWTPRRSSHSVAKTHRAVVAEEGWPFAGVGAQVVDIIQRDVFDELDAPVLRVTGADVPMPYNKHLEKAAKVGPAKDRRGGQAGHVPWKSSHGDQGRDGGALPHDGGGAPRRVEEAGGRRGRRAATCSPRWRPTRR